MITKPQQSDAGRNLRKQHKARLKDFRFGTWNTLSLYRPGALQLLLEQLDSYRMDVVAIQEIRWTGQGTFRKEHHTIYYSGHQRFHTYGTGFVVSRRFAQLVIDFKPVNCRICYIRIKGKFLNYSLISAHAPTEPSEELDKDQFYEDLEKCLDECPKADIKVILGDFNAQLGKEDIFRPTIGSHSIHDQTNDNGQRLINFAASKGLVVGSTLFPHKRVHMATWKSNDGVTANQIDHIVMSARHISGLMDVRSYRGANIDSDHYLTVARIRARISLARLQKSNPLKRFNVNKLKDEGTSNAFSEKLEEKLKGEPGTDENNQRWTMCANAISEAAEEIIGFEERIRRSPWFDEECRRVTAEKNKAYQTMVQKKHIRSAAEAYKTKRREEKRTHRRKKREWHNKELADIEQHSGLNENRKFYRKLNEGRKPFQPKTSTCRDIDGTLLSDNKSIMKRWMSHFHSLLNKETEAEQRVFNVERLIGSEDLEPPDEDEIMMAIERLKNNKAPGYDNLPAELFKHGGNELVKMLRDMVLTVWNEERMPKNWNMTVICPIFKKGDTLECQNYRGISLLPCVYKVFSNTLYQRILPYAENIVGKYQAGFRRNKSTIDQIFCLRTLLGKTREHKIPTHHLFIDFEAAYDSVLRPALYDALIEMGVPLKLVRLIRMTLQHVQCVVRAQGELSEQFQTERGVRQGDSLACLLFNLALEFAVRRSDIQIGGTIFDKSVQILAYADDIDLIGRSLPAVKEAFMRLESSAREMGLRINERKTKYMCTEIDQANEISIAGYTFEGVNAFVYLGSQVDRNCDMQSEIKRRIVAANRCLYGLYKYMRSRLISRKSKVRMYKALIRPVLTYASECWTLTKSDELSMLRFERKILRKIFGPIQEGEAWRQRTNRELDQLYKDIDVVRFIKIGRLRWAGHIARMGEEEIPKKVLDGQIFGKRRVGRPKMRWSDGVCSDARSLLHIRNWRQAAQNRENWRAMLEEARTHTGL